MDRYKETFETWNNIASIYQDKFMSLNVYNDTYDYICDSVSKPSAKLLEVGCGPGNITQYLLSKRPDYDIFGIDIAPNMIEFATKNNPSANFAVMDCRHINHLDRKYDGIISGFCLPYLSNTECCDLISHSFDLLNDNGLIYLSLVEGDPAQSGFKSGSGGRVFFYFHDIDELKKQLSSTQFEDIRTFKVEYKTSDRESEIHTILTAKKRMFCQSDLTASTQNR